MTVQTTDTRVEYTGTGSASVFPYGFPIIAASDLEVTQIDASSVETILVLNVDYTVSGAGGPSGGNVTLLGGNLPSGYRLVIQRKTPYTQETDFRNQGSFTPQAHEAAIDKVTMLVQQLLDSIGTGYLDSRVLRLGDADVDGSGSYRAKSNKIQDLASPTAQNDAANLGTLESYVDSVLAGGGTVTPTEDSFTGTGALTQFTLTSAPAASAHAYLVFLDGVEQRPVTDYTIDQPNLKINFTAAPGNGTVVTVRPWGYNKGLPVPAQYTAAAKPSPGSEWHGKFIRIYDAGSPERLEICLLNGAGAYSWNVVAVGA